MATVQNPFRAPPGTVIRPDGVPAGRGGRFAVWLALGVVAAALFTYGWESAEREHEATRAQRAAPRHAAPVVPEPAVAPEPDEPIEVAEPEPTPPEPPPPDRDDEEVPYVETSDDDESSDAHELTAVEVTAAVAKVRAKIAACGDKHLDAVGTVYVTATITTAGRVSKVEVVDTPKAALGACVARELKRARFPRSRGAVVNYPFRF